jgi:pullulanase/glycogen debranching enzyme
MARVCPRPAGGTDLRLPHNRPYDPGRGVRFDPSKVLLDPYGKSVVVPTTYSRRAASEPGENTATAMKSVVVDHGKFDWEGDAPLRHPWARTVKIQPAVAAPRAALRLWFAESSGKQ